MQGVERSRKEHRDRPRLRERAYPILPGVLQVVGGERSVPRGKTRPAEVGKLVGVKLHGQSEGACAPENAIDLGRAEGDPLAEAVHRVRQALRMSGLQRGQAHLVDVGVGAARVLRWDGVGAEEARAHPDRPLAGDAARGTQHRELGVDVEAVAGLDLDGRDPLGDQRIDAGEGAGEERLGGRLPGRFDGGEDAAAGPRDLLVAHPLEPHLELARAVAAVDEVRVTVDQRRGDKPAVEVAPRPRCTVGGQYLRRPAPGDATTVQGYRALGDEAIGRFATLHGGQCQIGEELP